MFSRLAAPAEPLCQKFAPALTSTTIFDTSGAEVNYRFFNKYKIPFILPFSRKMKGIFMFQLVCYL